MECRCQLPAECPRCLASVCENVLLRVGAAGCVPVAAIARMVAEARPVSGVAQQALAAKALAGLVVVGEEARSPLYHARCVLKAAPGPVLIGPWVASLGLQPSVASSMAHRPGPGVIVYRDDAGAWWAKWRRGLGAHDRASLLRALAAQGCRGTPLPQIYGEYEGAHTHVHTSPDVFIAHGLAWHTSVACSEGGNTASRG